MAAYLAEPGPAVSDHHRPDLFEQRLDRGRLAAGRPGRQITEAGRLADAPYRSYLVFCRSRHGQRPDYARLSHDGIMPR